MSTTWTEQRRICCKGVQWSQNDNDAKMRRRRRQCGQLAVTMLSPLLLSPPTTSCLLLFLPVPICSCLLLPARTSPYLLPLPATESCLADLLMPPPTSSERCQRGLVEPLGGMFGSFSTASWAPLGGFFGGFVKPLGASWGLLETAGRLLGACWGSWGLGGLLGDLLGASRRPVGDLVGVSWGRLRGSWNLLGSLWGASLSLLGGL